MPSYRTTIWLFVIALLTSLFAWFTCLNLPSWKDTALPASLIPNVLKHPDFFSVNTTNFVLQCTREHGVWKIDNATNARVDGRHVSLILNTLSQTTVRDRITLRQRRRRGLGLDDYGLVVPHAVVVLANNERSTELRIGNFTPYDDCVFLMTGDSTDIYVADRIVLDMLPTSIERIRDRSLLSDYESEIVAIEIRQAGRELVFLSKETGDWRLTSPLNVAASHSAVQTMLETIKQASIRRFVWTPKASGKSTDAVEAGVPYGLTRDESTLGISLWYKNNRIPVDITFGNADLDDTSNVYVMSSADASAIYTIAKSTSLAFTMDIDEIRARRIFQVQFADIVSMSFQNVDNVFTLSVDNDSKQWIVSRPSAQKADQDAIYRFIIALQNLEDSYVKNMLPDEFGNSPIVDNGVTKLEINQNAPKESVAAYLSVVEAEGADDVAMLEVALPSKRLKHYLPMTEELSELFTLKKISSLMSKEIFSIPQDTISSISRIERGKEQETVILGREGKFYSTRPLPIVVNEKAVTNLLSLLSAFNANRVETCCMTDPSKYGLSNPSVEYTITTNDEKTPVIVARIGDKLSGNGVFVNIKGKEAVFVVSDEAADIFATKLLINPIK